jgi:DASH complex subunit SPC19
MTTQSQSQSLSSLSSSVTSLRHSLSLLDSSISILDSGISDFPRLKTVLSSPRSSPPHPPISLSLHPRWQAQHFELTPSTTLLAAQSSLASELAPAISTLLSRADIYISKLERKQNNLTARSELLEGRLEGTKVGGVKRQRSLEKLVRKTGLVAGGGEDKALR